MPQQLSDQAIETLVQKVKLPAFLQKLAQHWNVVPQSEADVQALCEMAAYVRAARAQEQVKTASQANPFLSSVLDGLKEALGTQGMAVGPTQHEQLLSEAAFRKTASDEEVARAALEYAQHLASLDA